MRVSFSVMEHTIGTKICDHLKLENALFRWYQGHETRGAAVTGDVLTQKAKELALIPELNLSEHFGAVAGYKDFFCPKS